MKGTLIAWALLVLILTWGLGAFESVQYSPRWLAIEAARAAEDGND